MRVVGGVARGRPLVAPTGDRTRPTSDFVREAVFNSLQSLVDLQGATVLDLFAGTGAMGIEALSRGADHATFAERDRRALAALDRNLHNVAMADRATVLRVDVLASGATLPAVHVAFIDPPYVFDRWPELLARVQADLVVAESDRDLDFGDGWRVVRQRRYGSTVIALLTSGATQ